jgi:CRISPR/Cas system-associated exonuclease Cas4 (RecB family)
MPQVGWLDGSGKPVAFADALAISEAEGSWSNIPHEVLSLIEQQVTKERPDGITVTQLLGCPRKVFLEKENDYYQTPMDNWPALRGTIVHAMLEQQGGGGASVEVRYEKEHRGVVISGQPDNVRVIGSGKKRLLRDWKSTNNLPKYDSVYSSHRLQVNLYRWLMDLDPRFTEIEVVYISMDGVKAIPLKRGGTSRYGRAIADELMSNEQVEEYLDKRLFTLYAQSEAQKPLAYHNVDEEDLWNCNYCPVKNVCYKLAADEAKAAFIRDEPVNRVPPRQRKEKK